MKVPVNTVKDICQFDIVRRGKDDHFFPRDPSQDLGGCGDPLDRVRPAQDFIDDPEDRNAGSVRSRVHDPLKGPDLHDKIALPFHEVVCKCHGRKHPEERGFPLFRRHCHYTLRKDLGNRSTLQERGLSGRIGARDQISSGDRKAVRNGILK